MELRVVNLRRDYVADEDVVTGVRDLSFSVAGGSFWIINGASGSGKTTLLCLLAGIDSPSAGTVYWDNQDLHAMTGREAALLRREKLGMIFQNFELIPVLRAAENIEIPLILRKVPPKLRRERVREAANSLGIEGQLRKYPRQLSGGQLQRVAIARIFAADGRVVLADEVTSHLDSANSHMVYESLSTRCRERGLTVIAVCHDTEMNRYADEVRVMRDGRLHEEGS